MYETQAFHAKDGDFLTKIQIDSLRNSRQNSKFKEKLNVPARPKVAGNR